MDLTTTYLGLKLKNPVISGASPLVDKLDNVRRLEDAKESKSPAAQMAAKRWATVPTHKRKAIMRAVRRGKGKAK